MTDSLDRSNVPKIAPGRDLTRLPIGPREGFVLSRIDGNTSIGSIALLCGFPYDEVERIFAKLIELRAAYFGEEPPWSIPPPPPHPSDEAASTPRPPRSSPGHEARAGRVVMRQRPRRWSPAELDEPVEIDLELKTRILDLYGWLDDLDHYELLGVRRDAERRAIKSAYYGLASTFHTDRHFGKKLGSFKAKMETIFGRVTAAHDALAHKSRRVEYDAYLADRDRTKAFERYVAGEDPYDPPVTEPPMPDVATPDMATEQVAPIEPAPPADPDEPPPSARSAAEQERRLRREALARRLVGLARSRAPVAPPTPEPPPAATPEQSMAAAEALRRRYEDGKDHARKTLARNLIDAANKSLASDDLLAAANNLRLALNYDEDEALRRHYEEVNQRAREAMADAYLKQARYEEQDGKWGPAANSYVKAHEGRPDDATLCERAAHALRMEGRDLHKAARFAELAVQKSPSNAEFRVTLGAVYLDAGLFLRARSELEQAAKLDPSSAVIKDLLARARQMAS